MKHHLYTENLGKTWGAFKANSELSLRFEAGARHAIIGPNGAGKTTFINLLTGVLTPTTGQVFLGDKNITALPQHERVRLGMTRTFQINTLFAGLTVLESVVLVISEREGLSRHWFKPVSAHTMAIEEALQLLNKLQLAAQAHDVTRSLPYGKQRLLEIALALATRPKILLLDEPAAGIPTKESAELFEVIAALPKEVTVLFIEHDMNLVFQFADYITVLVGGQCFAQGTPEQISQDPRVKEVYLGESHV